MKKHQINVPSAFKVKWMMFLALVSCCLACGSNTKSPDSDPNAGYSTPPTNTDKDSPGQTYNYNTDTTLMPPNTPDSPPPPPHKIKK